MTVTVNEAGMQQFFGPFGPVALLLREKARRVEEIARENASGKIIGIESGDLLGGLRSEVTTDERGLRATVGTDAQHRDFDYPAFHDEHGRPWLTSALAEVFNG